MPYKSERLRITKRYDRRIKLSDSDKKNIKKLYGKISQRKLASAFGVSRRLIQFIGDPSKHKRNLLCRQARGGSNIYYDRLKHNEAMRKYREYRNRLFKEGLIK